MQPVSIYRQYSTNPTPLDWNTKKRNGKQASDETATESPNKDDNQTPATVFKTKYSDTQRFPEIREIRGHHNLIKKRRPLKTRVDQDLYKFPYDGPDVWLEELLMPKSAAAESPTSETEPQKQHEVVTPEAQPGTTSMQTENRTYEKKSIESVLQEFRDQQKGGNKAIVPKKKWAAKKTKSRSAKSKPVLSENKLESSRPNSSPVTPNTTKRPQSPAPTAIEGTQSPSTAEKTKVKGKESELDTPLPPSYFAEWNENSPHPQKSLEELDPDLQTAVRKITQRERTNDEFDLLDLLNEWYTKLPKPRVCYFHRRTISGIFNVLSLSDTYDNSIASLYMQIFSDMQANESILKLSEWTRLIDIAGKGFVLDKDVRVDLALKTFQDMQRWCVVADDSLLTSLLQIAVRAKQWSTASLIDNELYKRKAQNLIIWTERVKIAGKQNDLPKILQAYKDFAASGLPVDIAFVNTLLEALLNVGQGDIAESIYLRLRQMIVERYEREEIPVRTTKFAVRRKRKDSLRKQAQQPQRDLVKETENLVPNRSTIRRFISYHCHYTGRMSDVAFYLNELDAFGFAPNYGTYVDIFHGFFLWHEPEGGEWSGEKLASVYSVIHEGLLHGNLPFAISFVLALTAIRAHGRVLGAEKAREVWEMLKPHMRINENVRDQEMKKVRALENMVKMFEKRGELPWQMVGGEQLYRVLDWRN